MAEKFSNTAGKEIQGREIQHSGRYGREGDAAQGNPGGSSSSGADTSIFHIKVASSFGTIHITLALNFHIA